jgi:hypothetical protein
VERHKINIGKLQPKSTSFIEFSKKSFMQTQNTLKKQDIECKNNNKSNKIKEKSKCILQKECQGDE